MIFLYRRALLDYWCETDEPLADIVRNTLIHEIGHHFGYSDDDMEHRVRRGVHPRVGAALRSRSGSGREPGAGREPPDDRARTAMITASTIWC